MVMPSIKTIYRKKHAKNEGGNRAINLNQWGEPPREPSLLRFDAPKPARQEPRPTSEQQV
jgi:hypothetical protein